MKIPVNQEIGNCLSGFVFHAIDYGAYSQDGTYAEYNPEGQLAGYTLNIIFATPEFKFLAIAQANDKVV